MNQSNVFINYFRSVSLKKSTTLPFYITHWSWIMVLILDGNSDIEAHVYSDLGLFKVFVKIGSNRNLKLCSKRPVFLFLELPSDISTME